MVTGPFLGQRLAQSQTLALTPAMQLKLKLWQMNLQELNQTIEHELEENPLLELAEDGDETPTLEAIEEGRDSDVAEDTPEAPLDAADLPEGQDPLDLGSAQDASPEMNPEGDLERFTEEGVAQVQETDMGAENSWDQDLPRTSALPDEDRLSWEDRLSAFETLQDHLLAQLYETLEHEDLQAAVEVLQEFDPSGVGCFTVQECLLLQLRHAGFEPDDLAVQLIQDHAALLAQRDSTRLRRALGCSEADLAEAMDHLKHLNPSPGRAFDSEADRVVKPDVVVLRGEDGHWKVYLNDEGLPRLRVNGDYQRFMASAEVKSDKDYIRERFRSARDFIRGVEDRNRTVLRVSAQIVELQRDFLDQGVEGLRPMVLRDVAEATGFHESTISRVVKAKTIHTPQGLFDLNYFFSARPKDSDVSATVVKHRIKALVQAEDPARPLSDEALAGLLERDGIKVARRTVNKYREELRIPPASQRRRR